MDNAEELIMSFNRNKFEDKRKTEQVLFYDAPRSKGLKNWLDHSQACAKIDEMLISGANFNQLLTSGRRPSAVKAHIYHLKSEHGLPVSDIGGVYKFDISNTSDITNKTIVEQIPNVSEEKNKNSIKFEFSRMKIDLEKIQDEREKTSRLISQRQGQASFRNRLKEAYNNRCIITGCDVVEALEAAHIIPYLGDYTNIVSNGLLLRSDVHNLFDFGLITIDADGYRVIISDRLKGTTYEKLSMKQIKLPSSVVDYPDKGALKWHRNEIFDR